MDQDYSVDWWRHELYRHVAHFVHNPGDDTQAKISALITEYRRYSERQQRLHRDEHEYPMNYR